LQVSSQAELQQTPSTQNPLWQSPPHPHAWPIALGAALGVQVAGGASPPSGVTLVVPPPPHPVATAIEATSRTSRDRPY
jgi:hypothetical protein